MSLKRRPIPTFWAPCPGKRKAITSSCRGVRTKLAGEFLEQPFVHDPSKSVAQILKEAESKVGKPVSLKGFVRFALGEGIEKEEAPDFAAEVAAAAGTKA